MHRTYRTGIENGRHNVSLDILERIYPDHPNVEALRSRVQKYDWRRILETQYRRR